MNSASLETRTFTCFFCGEVFAVNHYSKLARYRHGCEGSVWFFQERRTTWKKAVKRETARLKRKVERKK
jgi:hypothetical protein